MALKILIAGFGRFPGAPVNPSALLVARLARLRRPAFRDIRCVAHVFPTRYDVVARDLPALIAREKPDAVVLFGVASRAERMRIELLARNRMSLVFPDAGGFKPARGPIEIGGPCWLTGMSPVRLLAAARAAGTQATLSRHAGTYLCNYAYWHALQATRTGSPRLAVFVHVPPLRLKPARRRNARAPTLVGMTKAGAAIVLAVAAAASRSKFVPAPSVGTRE